MSKSSTDSYVLVPKSAVREDYKDGSDAKLLVPANASISQSTSSLSISVPSSLSISYKISKQHLKSMSLVVPVIWSPSFTTSVKYVSTKIDVTSDTEVASLCSLYDEFRYDSVSIAHYFTNADVAQAQALGVGAMAVDINSDGGTAVPVLGLLRLQHHKVIEWGNSRPDRLSCPLTSQSNATGMVPAWQKTSLLSSTWPGGIYVAANGFPSATHALSILYWVKMSFRTKQ
jgi:hypothetical protein